VQSNYDHQLVSEAVLSTVTSVNKSDQPAASMHRQQHCSILHAPALVDAATVSLSKKTAAGAVYA
jgi:hypothetical protein